MRSIFAGMIIGVDGRCGHCASADPPGKTARLWIYAGSDRSSAALLSGGVRTCKLLKTNGLDR
jgi:hypothetical protein